MALYGQEPDFFVCLFQELVMSHSPYKLKIYFLKQFPRFCHCISTAIFPVISEGTNFILTNSPSGHLKIGTTYCGTKQFIIYEFIYFLLNNIYLLIFRYYTSPSCRIEKACSLTISTLYILPFLSKPLYNLTF